MLAGIGTVSAFKLMFYAYAALGVLSALLYRLLWRFQVEPGDLARLHGLEELALHRLGRDHDRGQRGQPPPVA